MTGCSRRCVYGAFSALTLILLAMMNACSSAQLSRALEDAHDLMGADTLTTEDVIKGLKEALNQGGSRATEQASALDGYLENPELRIPFPQEIEKVETTLRDIGLDREVDRFIVSMNRAAEKAAEKALPIFGSAIKSMTVEDAWQILRGGDDEATRYLERTTSDQLYEAFQPVVRDALDTVHATRYYSDLIGLYNSLPLVKPVNPNLDEYVTHRAMDGLFVLMAKEEARIRENPLARTTELMRRVFAEQD
jgi:hypothetical protein